MKISIHNFIQTKPLNKFQSNYLGNMINRTLYAGRGKNIPFRLRVGDRVLYTTTQAQHTVIDTYRENGHNKVATADGFYREQDLMKITKKGMK